jgi:putative NADPH-quinone reductase
MPQQRPIVLLGSSRSDGETRRAVDIAFGDRADCVDLAMYDIGPYDYGYGNREDEFLKVAELMLSRDRLVFATPVYWYSMSGTMKVFFDRLTDLTDIEKKMGRALAGKQAWLIATGTDEALPQGFEVPFSGTCAYFDIEYRDAAYLYTGNDPELREESEASVRSLGLTILQPVYAGLTRCSSILNSAPGFRF